METSKAERDNTCQNLPASSLVAIFHVIQSTSSMVKEQVSPPISPFANALRTLVAALAFAPLETIGQMKRLGSQ